jgi:hypothetical protein
VIFGQPRPSGWAGSVSAKRAALKHYSSESPIPVGVYADYGTFQLLTGSPIADRCDRILDRYQFGCVRDGHHVLVDDSMPAVIHRQHRVNALRQLSFAVLPDVLNEELDQVVDVIPFVLEDDFVKRDGRYL